MNSIFRLVEGVSSARVLKVVTVGIALFGCFTSKTNGATSGNLKTNVESKFLSNDLNLFANDKFIVILNADARKSISVRQDQNGRPIVSSQSLQEVINSHGVTSFKRQFKTAKPEAAGSKLYDLTGHYKVKVGSNVSLDAVMNAFSKNPNVARVEKIGIYPIHGCATGSKLTPNDSYYDDINPPPDYFGPGQWSLSDTHGIDADIAWSTESGSTDVVVVAMDTGVRYYHQDLGGTNPPGPADNDTNGNIWVNTGETPDNGVDDDNNGYIDDVIGWDFVSVNVTGTCGFDPLFFDPTGEDCEIEDNDPRDANGHGTHVAGTMAAISNNGYGIAGVAGGYSDGTQNQPSNGVKIMSLRVGWMDVDPDFGLFLVGYVSMDYVAEAMQYAIDMKSRGVNVVAINASWGSEDNGGISQVVQNVLASGIMIIKSAGNSGIDTPDFIASIDGVMNVAATDQTGGRASFSNFGSWVDIAAPGEQIISTYHDYTDPSTDYEAYLDGTSMAAPHVAGVAALLKSLNPNLDGPAIFDLLVNNTCEKGTLGIGPGGNGGILNAKLALNAANPCLTNSDCDNGNFCDGAETCDVGTGVCVPGTNPCDDNVLCTIDVCNEINDSCTNTPDHTECDDILYCNGIETCDPGLMSSEPGLGCRAGTAPCSIENCDEGNNICIVPPGCTVNADCDDGLFCSGTEICVSDLCQSSGNPCTSLGQICDEAGNQCVDAPQPPACGGNKASCNVNGDCCSNNCRNGSCKGN